jgi:hypothetical protein
MVKRLNVILSDHEYREILRIAEARHMPVAEWVLQALAEERRREYQRDPREKVEALRAAVRHKFPSGDIDSMLNEIEGGYLKGLGHDS